MVWPHHEDASQSFDIRLYCTDSGHMLLLCDIWPEVVNQKQNYEHLERSRWAKRVHHTRQALREAEPEHERINSFVLQSACVR